MLPQATTILKSSEEERRDLTKLGKMSTCGSISPWKVPPTSKTVTCRDLDFPRLWFLGAVALVFDSVL